LLSSAFCGQRSSELNPRKILVSPDLFLSATFQVAIRTRKNAKKTPGAAVDDDASVTGDATKLNSPLFYPKVALSNFHVRA
jgi:hypothetical protein